MISLSAFTPNQSPAIQFTSWIMLLRPTSGVESPMRTLLFYQNPGASCRYALGPMRERKCRIVREFVARRIESANCGSRSKGFRTISSTFPTRDSCRNADTSYEKLSVRELT